MVFVLDNYDSFTYNLVQYLGELGAAIRVRRNDQVTLEEIAALQPTHIVISPGPGRPEDAGITEDVIRRFSESVPLLGVCLGHQAIGSVFGGRIVRAQVQSVGSMDFVEAARSLGLGHGRILFRHILPNTLGPIIVYTTLTIPGVMLFEATLSFLGLGVKPPNSSWGVLIQEGANAMFANPWPLVFPSVLFSLTLFSLNFLGDGLRDALDPKSAK